MFFKDSEDVARDQRDALREEGIEGLKVGEAKAVTLCDLGAFRQIVFYKDKSGRIYH
jgi:hypothetical protein